VDPASPNLLAAAGIKTGGADLVKIGQDNTESTNQDDKLKRFQHLLSFS